MTPETIQQHEDGGHPGMLMEEHEVEVGEPGAGMGVVSDDTLRFDLDIPLVHRTSSKKHQAGEVLAKPTQNRLRLQFGRAMDSIARAIPDMQRTVPDASDPAAAHTPFIAGRSMKNEAGGPMLRAEMNLPPAHERPPGLDLGMIRAILQGVENGVLNPNNRVTMLAPNEKGKAVQVFIGLPDLVRIGQNMRRSERAQQGETQPNFRDMKPVELRELAMDAASYLVTALGWDFRQQGGRRVFAPDKPTQAQLAPGVPRLESGAPDPKYTWGGVEGSALVDLPDGTTHDVGRLWRGRSGTVARGAMVDAIMRQPAKPLRKWLNQAVEAGLLPTGAATRIESEFLGAPWSSRRRAVAHDAAYLAQDYHETGLDVTGQDIALFADRDATAADIRELQEPVQEMDDPDEIDHGHARPEDVDVAAARSSGRAAPELGVDAPGPGAPAPHIGGQAWAEAERDHQRAMGAIERAHEVADNPNRRSLKHLGEGINAALRSVGIETEALTVDASDLAFLAERGEGLGPRNLELIQQTLQDDPAGRVLFLQVGEGGGRRPVVYISDRVKSPRVRSRIALHETGHIVMRDAFERMSTDEIQALETVLGPMSDIRAFEENFANAFSMWFTDRPRFKAPGVEDRIAKVASNFFQRTYEAVRRVWQRWRNHTHQSIPFREFMDGLLGKGRRTEGDYLRYDPDTLEGRPLADAMDYTPSTARDAARAAEKPLARKVERVYQEAKRGGKITWSVFDQLWSSWLKPYDQVLRNMGLDWLADHYRRQPGVREQIDGDGTPQIKHVEREMREHFTNKLHGVLDKHLPRSRWRDLFRGAPQPSPEMRDALENSALGQRAQTEGGRQVQDELQALFDEVRDFMRSKGVDVGHQEGYWLPIAYSWRKAEDAGISYFEDKVVEWARNNPEEARGHFLRARTPEVKTQGKLNRDERMILAEARQREKESPMDLEHEARKLGRYLYETITQQEGIFNPSDPDGVNPLGGGDFVSPGMQHARRRDLPDSLHRELHEMREMDVASVAFGYINKGIRRATTQEAFGAKNERWGLADTVREIEHRYDLASSLSNMIRNDKSSARTPAAQFVEQYPRFREVYQEALEAHPDTARAEDSRFDGCGLGAGAELPP